MSKKGFTLVEIIVVVAITALISGIVISYSKTGENQLALYVETQKIASAILRAKSLAIATFDKPASGPGRILCGYGFDLDYPSRTYRIFSYEPAAATCSGINPIQNSDRVPFPNSSSTLPRGITWNATPPDRLWTVLFIPPAPQTLISTNPGGAVGLSPGKIYLSTEDGSGRITIEVTPAGQVDF